MQWKRYPNNDYCRLLPRFRTLRRVPMCYRHILPLKMMKHYQCLIVGAAGGTLTVAITDRQPPLVATLLSKVTRRAIFPVLVDPVRMRLILQRLERYEHTRGNVLGYLSSLHRLQAHSIVTSLMCQQGKIMW